MRPTSKGRRAGRNITVSRTAVITGGTGGLGTSLCGRLLDRGYRLAVTYLVPDEAARFEEKFEVDDDRLLLRRCDATNAEAVRELFAEIGELWGHIDGLAALVGGWAGGRTWRRTMTSPSNG